MITSSRWRQQGRLFISPPREGTVSCTPISAAHPGQMYVGACQLSGLVPFSPERAAVAALHNQARYTEPAASAPRVLTPHDGPR